MKKQLKNYPESVGCGTDTIPASRVAFLDALGAVRLVIVIERSHEVDLRGEVKVARTLQVALRDANDLCVCVWVCGWDRCGCERG